MDHFLSLSLSRLSVGGSTSRKSEVLDEKKKLKFILNQLFFIALHFIFYGVYHLFLHFISVVSIPYSQPFSLILFFD